MKSLPLLTLALCTAGLVQSTHAAVAEGGAPATAAPSAAAAAKFVIPDPVAVVEGKEIKAADVEKTIALMMQRAGKQPSDLPEEEKPQAVRSVVDTLISQQLVVNLAAAIKVTDEEVDARFQEATKQLPDPKQLEEQLKANNMTVAGLKDQIRETIRQRKWLDEQTAGKTAVTDAEANEFYTSHASYFDAPETVRASHILIKVPEDAKPEVVAEKEKAIGAVAKRIDKGEDFAKVAAEVSEDTGSKDKGGDLDFFPKQAMVPEFADAAFALKKDEVSKPVKSKFGFHIIKLTDRKEAHKVPFEEAKPRIVAFLTQDKQKKALREVLQQIRAKAEIKNNLPPAPAPAPMPEAKP